MPGRTDSERNKAHFRFYEELNDFLPPDRVKQTITYRFDGNPGVKDSIQALGVPHTEVDLILVNGESVDFNYHLRDGDRVAVYPVFELFDISPLLKLRPKPLRRSRFILDVHLGKLARYLRLMGFDCLYRNDYSDSEIARLAASQERIILTRDRKILYYNIVTRGYWLRSLDPTEQLYEVIDHFDLYSALEPFTRCPACNGELAEVEKNEIEDRLEPKTKEYFNHFKLCQSCGKIYWHGSHFDRLDRLVEDLRGRGKKKNGRNRKLN